MEARRSHVVESRLDKLERLRELGIEPYAYSYDVSHTTAAARSEFEAWESDGDAEAAGDGPNVRVAGRLAAIRTQGKSVFADLADRTGRIQLFLRANEVGPEAFEVIGLLDIGDWIGVEGPLLRTRMGEVSVLGRSVDLLSKSLRPLPFGKEQIDAETGERRVFSGFADREQRYRQRYADMAVNPEVREVFATRGRIVTALRTFLDRRGYIEVETPVLQPLYGGASARPFQTHHNALDMPLFLRIADELYLKRLIVGGMERVYEIAKDFRNEGIDTTHNPEFTMLEFYEAFADYETMMTMVEEMLGFVVAQVKDGGLDVTFAGQPISFAPPFRRLGYIEALAQIGGIDVNALDDRGLVEAARAAGVDEPGTLSRPKLLDELFKETVEAKLIDPVFIVDYPRELSPLAKPKRGDPTRVERFELMIAGREIANAFSELNDPLDQRERFEAQVRLRQAGDEEAHSLDEDYLRALEYGMPPTGGVGNGVDRLAMLLTDSASNRDVILFPTMRPE
jgi:lysyl-tRNA synthetase class 2